MPPVRRGVILDGLSYRRAGRMVGISKTEVGDSLNLLLGALGICQPDGTFVTSLADLTDRLVEMAATGEAAVVDGLATECTPWSTAAFGGWPSSGSAGTPRSATGEPKISAPMPNVPTTATRPGCAPWWSSRSGIWQVPGRCAAGAAC
jgi:hypothetical protein